MRWQSFGVRIGSAVVGLASAMAALLVAVGWSSIAGMMQMRTSVAEAIDAKATSLADTLADSRTHIDTALGHQGERLGREMAQRQTTLRQSIELVDTARLIQLRFGDQLLQWKKMIIYGYNEDYREQYWQGFLAAGGDVTSAVQALTEQLADPADRAVAEAFAEGHAELMDQWRNANVMVDLNESLRDGLRSADQYMDQKDAPVSARLDELVVRLQSRLDRDANGAEVGTRELTEGMVGDMVGAVHRQMDEDFGGLLAGVEHSGASLNASVDRSIDGLLEGYWFWGGIALVVTMVGLGISLVILRRVVVAIEATITELRNGCDVSNSAAGQLAVASRQLADEARAEADQLVHITEALDEVGAQTTANRDNALQSQELSQQSDHALNTTQGTIAATVSAVDTRFTSLDSAIEALVGATERTAQIAKAIDDVAFQTNMLALNAAVEAARAGDAGAGFAVVAEEVRNLAARCQTEVRHSEAVIEEVRDTVVEAQRTSQATRELVQQDLVATTNASLTGLADLSHRLRERMELVTRACTEQEEGLGDIGGRVHAVASATQQNSSAAATLLEESQTMLAHAVHVESLVERLEGLAGRRLTASGPDTPNDVRVSATPVANADGEPGTEATKDQQTVSPMTVG